MAEGRERKKMTEKGENEKRPVVAIYKERQISGHEKQGGENMVIQLPRFLDFRNGY